jgi:hypothetical protein
MRLLSKAMKVLLAGVLGVGFGFVDVASADITHSPSICVLTYERDGSPIADGVLNVYENYSKATVKTEAVPADIIQCIDQGASEIVIIAHAVEIQNLKLGYFVRVANPGKNVEAPYYELELLLDHVFATASDALLAQEKAAVRRLTKIRMMACDRSQTAIEALPNIVYPLKIVINSKK